MLTSHNDPMLTVLLLSHCPARFAIPSSWVLFGGVSIILDHYYLAGTKTHLSRKCTIIITVYNKSRGECIHWVVPLGHIVDQTFTCRHVPRDDVIRKYNTADHQRVWA